MEQPSPFDLARLAALKEYAALEYELCFLLQGLLGVKHQVAAAIFYQISNTRSRYAIISRLIALAPESESESESEPQWRAWNKVEHWLGPCDTARNHLVHWFEDHMIQIAVAPGENEFKPVARIPLLRNATRRGGYAAGEKRYLLADVQQERDNFRVMLHIVNRFRLTVQEPEKWPWTDIFQQPAACRTPVEFLQRLNERGHKARLPPYDQ